MSEHHRIAGAIGGHTSWANTVDRAARSAKGQAGLRRKYARQIDPDGTLEPDELAKRVDNAMAAHYARMRLARAQKARKAQAS